MAVVSGTQPKTCVRAATSSSSREPRNDSPAVEVRAPSSSGLIGPSGSGRHPHAGGAWGGGVRPEEVIDKLTERIADRMRAELKLELQVSELILLTDLDQSSRLLARRRRTRRCSNE